MISTLLENFINYYTFLDANAFSSHSKLFRKLLLCLRLIFIQQLLKFNIFKLHSSQSFSLKIADIISYMNTVP